MCGGVGNCPSGSLGCDNDSSGDRGCAFQIMPSQVLPVCFKVGVGGDLRCGRGGRHGGCGRGQLGAVGACLRRVVLEALDNLPLAFLVRTLSRYRQPPEVGEGVAVGDSVKGAVSVLADVVAVRRAPRSRIESTELADHVASCVQGVHVDELAGAHTRARFGAACRVELAAGEDANAEIRVGAPARRDLDGQVPQRDEVREAGDGGGGGHKGALKLIVMRAVGLDIQCVQGLEVDALTACAQRRCKEESEAFSHDGSERMLVDKCGSKFSPEVLGSRLALLSVPSPFVSGCTVPLFN